VGGLPYIREKETQIIMVRESEDYMPWRKEIAPFLAPRYAVLYNWATQLAKDGDLAKQKKVRFPYEVLKADIRVESHEGYRFELGGVTFEIIALPGAEGTNSSGLWLPQHKVLFCGGGFVGPEFPMWPNIGTVRADKNRFMDAYLISLNKAIVLEPEIFLPGQDRPCFGKEKILANLIKIRDAVQYVRDEVVKGLIQGKDVYQLMQEIKLPPELADLSQKHGRVEWSIRSMVYHYGAWFQYRYTSELYPYRTTLMYPDLVELAGGAVPVIKRAQQALENGEPVKAMQLVEVALEVAPENKQVLETQLKVLQALLRRAKETYKTFSEIAWLQAEITKVNKKLEG
jgi:alkyl sulfatase BDS1-like metallo-beta-lactamase superfamily hydrolase